MSRVMYREWFPQIMYNHHQTGPGGAVMFAPPFRDPFNYNFHPHDAGQRRSDRIDHGDAFHRRGQARRRLAQGGGVLHVVERRPPHDGVFPQSDRHPDRDDRQPDAGQRCRGAPTFGIGSSSSWWSITPQEWHFRQSIEYSITANRAVLDFASRYRETNLYRIYQMGKDEIKWGNEDHWTMTPHKVEPGPGAVGGGERRLRRRLTRRLATGAAQAGGARCGGRRAARGGGGRGGGGGNALYCGAHDQGAARSARVHHAERPAGLRLGRAVRERADQVGHHGATRDGAVHGCGQAVSGQLADRQDGAGVPAARHGHVRAAGSPGRHSVPGRAAHAAVRQRRLHAGVPDGRAVRSRSSTDSTARSRS